MRILIVNVLDAQHCSSSNIYSLTILPYHLLAPLQTEAGVVPGQLLHGGGQALHGALHLVIIISMVMVMIVLHGRVRHFTWGPGW